MITFILALISFAGLIGILIYFILSKKKNQEELKDYKESVIELITKYKNDLTNDFDLFKKEIKSDLEKIESRNIEENETFKNKLLEEFSEIWNKNISEINTFANQANDRISILEKKLKPYDDLNNI